jgi:hypothetical protein
LVSIDSEDPRRATEDELRISYLASAFAESQHTFDRWLIPIQSNDVDLELLLSSATSDDDDDDDEDYDDDDDDFIISDYSNSTSALRARSKSNAASTTTTIKTRKSLTPFRPIKRFGRLLQRSWRQNIRNHRVNTFRLVASGGTAYLFTNIFQSIKKGGFFTSKSVADRVALLSFSVINMRSVLLHDELLVDSLID